MSMVDVAKEATAGLAKSAPQYLILLAVVGSFLIYMERIESRQLEKLNREYLIDEQRIGQCHDVQERGIEIMDKLNETLGRQASTLDQLQTEITRLTGVVDRLITRCD